MKLHAQNTPALNTVTAYGAGWVEVNRQRHDRAILIQPQHGALEWSAQRFEDLVAEHFDELASHHPEVVLFGTGLRQRFVHPRLLAGLMARGIGVETMDTGAACRTYNILMAEGRKVLAALLLG